ncbi:DNA-3-methyladenine glycosylase [Helicobacter sp. MIT 01-3238]|uniref:DNA-3-methyladenine glycosylase family protein n=1 Tax=Helicobacter sp. MIT 01-3238 TaxID=398627 RepID=UPI000E1F389A|nr:DNA-3-methyladenine glycosylase [Helicobacter sp. MIT 01-3238]RDU52170.1 DNA-3-methyladenine glycosylase 2 family protein [Helicobacter sp. MIT 01-3238]
MQNISTQRDFVAYNQSFFTPHIFTYTAKELDCLKAKDKRLAKAIDKIGTITREGERDIFASVIHHTIAQQISTKAQASIWARFCALFGEVENERKNVESAKNTDSQSKQKAQALLAIDIDKIRACGISSRKAQYILDFAHKVQSGEFDIEAVAKMSDEKAIESLIKLRGIGVWTAEMILLFCLQRKDILSYDDLALQRGLKMLYALKCEGKNGKIPKEVFATYRARFSPYGSIASLYLWEIASGKFEI